MRKAWLTIGCLLLGASSAAAQFRPGAREAKDQPLPAKVFLECGIVQTTGNYKKDEDPIYKITIDLRLDDSSNPTGLTVTHVSASGKSHIRDEQYSDSTLTNTPGKTEYFWSGKMANNKSYTMKGTLVGTVDNKWSYTEQQFRNGKQSFALRSACHEPDQTHMQPRTCDGQLIGPGGTAGDYGMRLTSDWATINTDRSGLDGCFFKVDSAVGKAIFANCTVGHRCLVVGAIQRVRGFFGNAPGGPAAHVLNDLFTALDITKIEDEAKRSSR